MRKAFILALLIVSAVGMASAQDEFKGFYIGGTAGMGIGRSDTQTTTVFDPAGYFASTSVPAIAAAGSNELHLGPNFTVGFDAGYNWRGEHWLVGVETEFGSMHMSDFGSNGAVYPCCAPTQFNIRPTVNTDWLFTLRPRVGYVAGKWLIYGTAGLAMTDIHQQVTFTDTFANAHESGKSSDTNAGWTAGGGLEYQATKHWMLRGEYLYADFGTTTATSTNLTTTGFTWPMNVFTHTADARAHIFRTGLNYRF